MNYEINSILEFIKRHIIALVVLIIVLILIVVAIQKALDKRAERIEDEKIKAYEVEIQNRLKIFQNYIDLANRDHETTTAILDAMSGMTRNINQLADNDREISSRVNEISSGEYKQARSQKNDQAAIRNGKAAKQSKPINVRELEALKMDLELYPDK